MGLVTGLAALARFMDRFERQHLSGMATQAIVVVRLDAGMRFVALIAVQPRHRYAVREGCL